MKKNLFVIVSLFVLAALLISCAPPKAVQICGEGNVASANGDDIRCKTDAPAAGSAPAAPAYDTGAGSAADVPDGYTDKVTDNGYRKFRKDADWVGDDFGPERTLPATVKGPAIAEFREYKGSTCGVVKVGEGQTFTWEGAGAFWEAGSQLALTERWEHHVAEYRHNYPHCQVYTSPSAVPNPTK